MGLIERDIGTERNYEAWFTDYPSTHRRAGQTVEVVTREAYERLHDQHRGAVEALSQIAHAYAGDSATMRTIAWDALTAMGVDPSTTGGQ
jgi:hypothetical protein